MILSFRLNPIWSSCLVDSSHLIEWWAISPISSLRYRLRQLVHLTASTRSFSVFVPKFAIGLPGSIILKVMVPCSHESAVSVVAATCVDRDTVVGGLLGAVTLYRSYSWKKSIFVMVCLPIQQNLKKKTNCMTIKSLIKFL